MKRIKLTKLEIRNIEEENPEALEALASMHSAWETEADAYDFRQSAKFHGDRRKELTAAASFIREAHEDDRKPVFDEEPEPEQVENPVQVQLTLTQKEAIKSLMLWWHMHEAQWELAGATIEDKQTALQFMGSGASTMVTVGEMREVMQALTPLIVDKE